MVVTYTRAQVEELLDWRRTLRLARVLRRSTSTSARRIRRPTSSSAPAGSSSTPPSPTSSLEAERRKGVNALVLVSARRCGSKGTMRDVRDGSAAWKAGLAPGMTILAVNGQAYDSELFNDALKKAQHSTAPIVLITRQTDWFQTINARLSRRREISAPRTHRRQTRHAHPNRLTQSGEVTLSSSSVGAQRRSRPLPSKKPANIRRAFPMECYGPVSILCHCSASPLSRSSIAISIFSEVKRPISGRSQSQ